MSRAKAKRMDSLEKAIEAALADGNFISYKAAWEFVEGLQRLADRAGELIASERTARRAFSRRLFRPAMRRRTRWTTPVAILECSSRIFSLVGSKPAGRPAGNPPLLPNSSPPGWKAIRTGFVMILNASRRRCSANQN